MASGSTSAQAKPAPRKITHGRQPRKRDGNDQHSHTHQQHEQQSVAQHTRQDVVPQVQPDIWLGRDSHAHHRQQRHDGQQGNGKRKAKPRQRCAGAEWSMTDK